MPRFCLPAFLSVLTLAAQPGPGDGSIAGRVLDSITSAPIRKAAVTLNAPGAQLWTESDAEGRFEFTTLPPGTYTLSASHAGYFDHPKHVAVGTSEKLAMDVRLSPQAVITGHILDEDGDPIAGAPVRLFKATFRAGRIQWSNSSGAQSNETGEYRIPNLPPGRYLVRAANPRLATSNSSYRDRDLADRPILTYYPTYYPNSTSQQDASPIELGIGTALSGVDIRFSRVPVAAAFHVKGKVVGVTPGSQNGVGVSFDQTDTGISSSGAYAKPPNWEFEVRLRPGQYRAIANVTGGPVAYATASLTVTSDVDGLVLTMSPPPVLTGQVVTAERDSQVSFEGLRLLVTHLDNHTGGQVQPGATGKFVFTADYFRPGRMALRINGIPNDCFLQSVRLGGREVDPDEFEVLTSTTLDVILSNTAAMITGRITGEDGKNLPDSVVTLFSADGKSPPARQSTDDGSFKLPSLRPGKYKLFAWEEVDINRWQDPAFLKKYEGYATEITVGPKETKSVELRAIPASEIK